MLVLRARLSRETLKAAALEHISYLERRPWLEADSIPICFNIDFVHGVDKHVQV